MYGVVEGSVIGAVGRDSGASVRFVWMARAGDSVLRRALVGGSTNVKNDETCPHGNVRHGNIPEIRNRESVKIDLTRNNYFVHHASGYFYEFER